MSSIDFLDEDEHAELFDWGNRAVLTNAARVSAPVTELFAAQATRSRDAVAVAFDGRQMSYGELDELSNRLAHHLVGLGAGPGQRVAVLLPRSADSVVAILAVLKSGAAYLPIDPLHPDARIRFMLADAEPTVAVTTTELAGRLDGCDIHVVDFAELRQHNEQSASLPVPSADDVAYLIYTSGTTGRPKGVA
ncbi:AMP-binding protein, partial [Mycolicibacterium fortuitum]|nr:AMP-binding protein [Mycolicibacterium fortuitum]